MYIKVLVGFTDKVTGERYLPGTIVYSERALEIKETLPKFVQLVEEAPSEEIMPEPETNEDVNEEITEKPKKKRK